MATRKPLFRACCTVLLFAVAAMSAPGSSPACTAFVLDHVHRPVVGANFDWPVSDGLIVINKSGIGKRAMSDPAQKLNPASWISRYGSVTFNMYGIDWPWAGMNQAGLVVTSMQLEETRYPRPDIRPSIHMAQWAQYQLDNFGSVTEVVANTEKIRIRPSTGKGGIHYLVCDATGNRAIVEFIEGVPLVYTRESMPIAALANDPYDRSLKNIKNFAGFGGHHKIPRGNTSYCRFARTADMLNRFGGGDAAATRQYAFDVLDSAGYKAHPRTDTQWSMVFDISERSILLKTQLNPMPRTIDLKLLDFACTQLPETLDIHTPLIVVGKNDLWEYNYEMNRRRFHGVFGDNPMKDKTYQEKLERIARYPETFICEHSTQR